MSAVSREQLLAALATGGLTPREMQVLAELAQGRTYAQAGRRLGVGAASIHGHAAALRRKLGAVNTAHAVHLAHQAGLLGPDPLAVRVHKGET